MARKKTAAEKKSGTPSAETRTYFKQADFPQAPLQQAQKIASAIVENFGAVGSSPPDIALALGISPTSSAWPVLAGASVAYGLTEGGVNANTIRLTPLGRKLVSPEEEGQDIAARREAIMKPRILKEFFERYRRAKFPNDIIGVNVLKILGTPHRTSTICSRNNQSEWALCGDC